MRRFILGSLIAASVAGCEASSPSATPDGTWIGPRGVPGSSIELSLTMARSTTTRLDFFKR